MFIELLKTRNLKLVAIIIPCLLLTGGLIVGGLAYRRYYAPRKPDTLQELLRKRDQNIAAGKTFHAYLALKQAANLAPDNAQLQREAGIIALEVGKKEEAHGFLERAWQQGIRDSRTLLMLVESSILPAAPKREYLFELIGQVSDSAQAQELRAFAYFNYKEYEKAQPLFAEIFRESGLPVAAEYDARCLIALKRVSDATGVLAGAEASGRLGAGGAVMLLNLYTAQGRGAEADALFARAWQAKDAPDEVALAYGYSLFNRREYSRAQQVLGTIVHPIRFCAADVTGPVEAAAALNAGAGAAPAYFSSHTRTLAGLANPTSYEMAEFSLALTTDLNRFCFPPGIEAIESAKRIDEVMRIFPSGLKRPDESFAAHEARVIIATILYLIGERQEIGKLAALAGGNTRWLEGERRLYAYLGASGDGDAQAQESLQQALMLLPDNPVVRLLSGDNKLRLTHYAEAIGDYSQTVSLNATFAENPHLLENMAAALAGEHKYSAGLRLVETLHRKNYLSRRSLELMRDLALPAGMPQVSLDAQQRLLKEFPDDLEIRFAGGRLLLALNQAEEALAVFRNLSAGNDDGLALRLREQELIALLALNRHEEALRKAEYARELGGYAAIALTALGRRDEAMERFAEVDGQGHMRPGWRVYYAGMLSLAGRGEDALRQLLLVLRDEPDDESANLELAALLLERGEYHAARNYAMIALESNPESWRGMLVIAAADLAFGNPANARELARRVILDNPESTEARYLLARALNALGEFAPAIEQIDLCLARRPDQREYLLEKVAILCGSGAFQQARELAEAGQLRHPQSPDFERALINVFMLSGDYPQALARIANARNLNPADKALMKSMALERKGDLRGALDALGQPAGEPRVDYRWAELKIAAGEYEGIQQRLRSSALSPRSFLLLGSLAEGARSFPAASMLYALGLERAPDDPLLLNNFAWATFNSSAQRYAEAHAAAQKAAALMPDSPEVLSTCAQIYNAGKRYDQTVHVLRRNSRILLHDPRLLLYLGQAYEAQGNDEEAYACYKRALNIEPLVAPPPEVLREHLRRVASRLGRTEDP